MRTEVVETEEREVLVSPVTRTYGRPGRRRKKVLVGKGLSEVEGRVANQLLSCLSG